MAATQIFRHAKNHSLFSRLKKQCMRRAFSAKTVSGKAELKNRQSDLAADETRVLKMIDGKSSIARLISLSGDLLTQDFFTTALSLQQRGLICICRCA
jgi:hypothetical protein